MQQIERSDLDSSSSTRQARTSCSDRKRGCPRIRLEAKGPSCAVLTLREAKQVSGGKEAIKTAPKPVGLMECGKLSLCAGAVSLTALGFALALSWKEAHIASARDKRRVLNNSIDRFCARQLGILTCSVAEPSSLRCRSESIGADHRKAAKKKQKNAMSALLPPTHTKPLGATYFSSPNRAPTRSECFKNFWMQFETHVSSFELSAFEVKSLQQDSKHRSTRPV